MSGINRTCTSSRCHTSVMGYFCNYLNPIQLGQIRPIEPARDSRTPAAISLASEGNSIQLSYGREDAKHSPFPLDRPSGQTMRHAGRRI